MSHVSGTGYLLQLHIGVEFFYGLEVEVGAELMQLLGAEPPVPEMRGLLEEAGKSPWIGFTIAGIEFGLGGLGQTHLQAIGSVYENTIARRIKPTVALRMGF